MKIMVLTGVSGKATTRAVDRKGLWQRALRAAEQIRLGTEPPLPLVASRVWVADGIAEFDLRLELRRAISEAEEAAIKAQIDRATGGTTSVRIAAPDDEDEQSIDASEWRHIHALRSPAFYVTRFVCAGAGPLYPAILDEDTFVPVGPKTALRLRDVIDGRELVRRAFFDGDSHLESRASAIVAAFGGTVRWGAAAGDAAIGARACAIVFTRFSAGQLDSLRRALRALASAFDLWHAPPVDLDPERQDDVG